VRIGHRWTINAVAKYHRTILTSDEIAHFHETGQVTPAARLDAGLIAGIETKMEALIAAYPELDPDYAPNLTEIDQSWLAYALMPEILDAIEQLTGANIIVWGSALFCKKGRGGTYWPMRPLEACSVWIAINPSTRANGYLRIIPGSHKAGRVLAYESEDRPEFILNQVVAARDMPAADPVDVILEPGMMSFHDVFTVHGAEPNDSGARRGGLVFRFMSSSSYYDRDLAAGQSRTAFNATRQLHLVRAIDVCARNDIYREELAPAD